MWDGVNFKIESAGFFFQEMSRDLIHPRHSAQSQHLEAIMVSTGASSGLVLSGGKALDLCGQLETLFLRAITVNL